MATANTSTSHWIKVDNTDPRILYRNVEQFGPFHGRGWTSAIGPSEDDEKQGPIYNNTLQVGPLLDISVEFPFEGIGVAVYGTVRPPLTTDAPQTESAYSVLGYDYAGVPSMFPYKASVVSNPKNGICFFSRSNIDNKNYTLTINVTNSTSNMPYYLDYIAIQLPGPDPSASASSSATSSAPITFGSDPPSATASNTDAPAVSGSSSVPKGAIIGAAIGGAALLTAVLLALLFWYKRRPKASPDYDYGSVAQQDTPPHIIPFVNPEQAAAMQQTGGGGLMFVPGLPQATSPSSSSSPQLPAVLPSQKALATLMGVGGRQYSTDLVPGGAGSSSVSGSGSDRKDPSAFQSASRPHTPGPASEAGSSSGASGSAPLGAPSLGYAQPPASELRSGMEDEESPPAYSPAPQ
ncbi:hypothetical protein C8Q77DRAFT_1218409 [Trametes polyzona]|nr:hypothetical protein C8Q77DRAFT_1218409 [Trametes polyzona]